MEKFLLQSFLKKEFKKDGFLFFLEKKEKYFLLSTIIFSEKEYIPISVRKCVERISSKKQKKYPFSLKIDEKKYSIQFSQKIPLKINSSYKNLEKMFIFSAKSWALILKRIAEQDFLAI